MYLKSALTPLSHEDDNINIGPFQISINVGLKMTETLKKMPPLAKTNQSKVNSGVSQTWQKQRKKIVAIFYTSKSYLPVSNQKKCLKWDTSRKWSEYKRVYRIYK